jgi:hypothetical protein
LVDVGKGFHQAGAAAGPVVATAGQVSDFSQCFLVESIHLCGVAREPFVAPDSDSENLDTEFCGLFCGFDG